MLVTALCLLVWADAPGLGAVRTCDLATAVRTAVRNNPDLEAGRLEVEQADARLREAWGYALPTVDVSGTYTRALKKPVFFLPDFGDLESGRVIPVEIGSDNSWQMGVTASQVLFSSAVFTGVSSAGVYTRAAREVYRAGLLETVTGVRKAFYGALLAGEASAAMQEALANAEENLAQARTLSAQGLLSEYDELRAEVAAANLRPEAMAAENAFAQAVHRLRIAMGVPYSDTLRLAGSLEYVARDSIPYREAAEAVEAGNPSLAALRLQIGVQEAIATIERSNYLPTLSAFGTYTFQAQRNDLRVSTRDFVSSAVVGLNLSLNVFSGLRTRARVEQADLETRKVRERVRALETTLQTLVESVLLRLRQAQNRIGAQEMTVEQARRGYRIAAARFAGGSGTQLEVGDAQLALSRARVNRMEAVFDYLVASADLDQLLGRLPAFLKGEISD